MSSKALPGLCALLAALAATPAAQADGVEPPALDPYPYCMPAKVTLAPPYVQVMQTPLACFLPPPV